MVSKLHPVENELVELLLESSRIEKEQISVILEVTSKILLT
jgi:hypothetical protein